MKNLLNTQVEAKKKLIPFKVGALFMEAGTGKTRVAVELVNPVQPDLVVWIGPFQTLFPDDSTIIPIQKEIIKDDLIKCAAKKK